ncbi:MAG: universal stress protein [Pseudomonadota bacterium]
MNETICTKQRRTFLVVIDDSDEMRVALSFACKRAVTTGGRVALLHVIHEDKDFHHWMGVADLMRQEQREEAERLVSKHSLYVKEATNELPILHIREGNPFDELFALLADEPSISIVVLAASTIGDGPGPIITQAITRRGTNLPVPFTIVPGHLSDAALDELT